MSTRQQNPPPALPHQETGTQFLRERTVAALFDEQGLGKSRQLIDAIIQERDAGNLDGALIICPNTIKLTWGEEIERYANVPMSLADSCLVRMSELLGESLLFTLDSDFRIYRRHGRQKIPLLIPPDR